MGATVTNCKRCNKVFQQVRQPLCPDCARIEDEKFSALYCTLQDSALKGGIAIDVLARQVKAPVEEIERYFLEGNFGTAGLFLNIYCQGCGLLCNANQRLGRYCVPCSESTAQKAGVEVQNLRDLIKRQVDQENREQQERMRRENQERRANYGKFGNTIRH
jgi:hypothetical protein